MEITKSFRLLVALLGFSAATPGFAQSPAGFTYKSDLVRQRPGKLVRPFERPQTLLVESVVYEAPEPEGIDHALKASLDAARERRFGEHYPLLFAPTEQVHDRLELDTGFTANVANGTPNDNSLAISNEGYVVSAVNTNIRIYNPLGKLAANKALKDFADTLGALKRTFDPRVLYDHKADRFIAMFLDGTYSSDNSVVIAFSKTSNPLEEWYYYQIEGSPLLPETWSDYPIIADSRGDLFLTLNLLKDSSNWDTGFRQSIIWQIDKASGYTGDSLKAKLYHSIFFDNKPIWSICPAQGSREEEGMYFLSVRPGDASNDTVFIHHINHDLASAPELSLKVSKTNIKYGVPPSALQPRKHRLATNDARVLSAIHANGIIHFAGNSIDPEFFSAAIHYGRIEDPAGEPIVHSMLISRDTMDFGYPSVLSASTGAEDHSAFLTFSHSSPLSYPGTSSMLIGSDGSGGDIFPAKQGLGIINVLLSDTTERWGDYTGAQVRYNKPGEFWISGSYGNALGSHPTFIGRLNVVSATSAIPGQLTYTPFNLYPNPAAGDLTLQLPSDTFGDVQVTLVDASGKEIDRANHAVQPSEMSIRISVGELPHGIYMLHIRTQNGKSFTQKFVRE